MLGSLCLALGTLGIFLPVLPTVPFYLVTMFCYSRSSKRLENWFKSTKLYEKHLASYESGQGMTRDTKRKIIATMTVTMLISAGILIWRELYPVCAVLAIVWICFAFWLFWRVPLKPESNSE